MFLRHDVDLSLEAANIIADVEAELLGLFSNAPVDTISFHRPIKELQGRKGKFAGRRHTYEPEFFSDCAYISDSNGGFHYGHPFDHPAVKAGKAIQLLTHPIWWSNERRTDPISILLNFQRIQANNMELAIKNTVKSYRDWKSETS